MELRMETRQGGGKILQVVIGETAEVEAEIERLEHLFPREQHNTRALRSVIGSTTYATVARDIQVAPGDCDVKQAVNA